MAHLNALSLVLFVPALLLANPLPAGAETLLVGNKGEDTVSFLDLASGAERARLATGKAPHEIAIRRAAARLPSSPMAARQSIYSMSGPRVWFGAST